jgi:peptidoglycan/LPS O-acetylase OafA/YrhL
LSTQLTFHRRPLKALTGIRFLAAVYVVIYHTKLGATLAEHGHIAAGHLFMSGYLAVAMFFLLSGFILSYTYAGQIDEPGSYRRFWEARFARIWPVYVVSLLLTSVAQFSFPKLSYILPTLLMVQAWNPFNRDMWGAWNYVCWTLSVEAFFYLCFPFYQRWIERLDSQKQLTSMVVMLGLGVAINSGVNVLGYASHGILHALPMPLIRLPEFLAGVGLGNYFVRKTSSPAARSRPSVSAFGFWTYGAAVVTIALLCRARDQWTSLVLIAFALLIFGLASERTLLAQAFSSRIMLFGGAISYSIYLLQAPVKDMVRVFADQLHIGSVGFRTGFLFALLLVLSAISFKSIEEPSRRQLRSMFATREEIRTVGKERQIAA